MPPLELMNIVRNVGNTLLQLTNASESTQVINIMKSHHCSSEQAAYNPVTILYNSPHQQSRPRSRNSAILRAQIFFSESGMLHIVLKLAHISARRICKFFIFKTLFLSLPNMHIKIVLGYVAVV